MSFVCYVITFSKNGVKKKYIGHTSNFKKRLLTHLRLLDRGVHPNKILQEFYYKGLSYDDDPEIIPFPTRESAHSFEISLIKDTLDDPEYVNIEIGGDTFTHNPRKDEIREVITSCLLSWMKSLSPEERKLTFSKPGNLNPMYGIAHSLKTKKLISEKLKEYYKTHTAPALGLIRSKETRTKLSAFAKTRTGNKNPFFGRIHSDETKAKLSKANKGHLPTNSRKISISGKEYSSLTEAGRQLKLNTTVVLWRVKSKNPKFAEWKFI